MPTLFPAASTTTPANVEESCPVEPLTTSRARSRQTMAAVASLGTAWDAKLLGSQTPTADGAAAALTTGVVIPGVMSTIAAPLQSSPGLAPVSISATRHVMIRNGPTMRTLTPATVRIVVDIRRTTYVGFQLVVGAVHSVPAQVTAVAADRPSPPPRIRVLQLLTEGVLLQLQRPRRVAAAIRRPPAIRPGVAP